jgi:hypothetical protein
MGFPEGDFVTHEDKDSGLFNQKWKGSGPQTSNFYNLPVAVKKKEAGIRPASFILLPP